MQHCLEMPANHFFMMLDQSRRMRALEQIESCDIAAIPACQSKYMESVRGRYERVLDLNKKEIREVKDSHPLRPVVESSSQDAKYLMMAFFSRGKS